MKKEFALKLVEKTKNDFDLIAEEFSRSRSRLWPELIDVFKEFVKDNDKVLDIGCGSGRLLDLFNNRQVSYIGIDISQGQIAEAKQKHPEQNFFTADALDLPLADNSFDKVFSVAVLHEIPSSELRQRFLKEAKRVLKRNGLIFLFVWDLRKRIGLLLKYSFLKIFKRSGLDWKDVFVPWGSKTERYYHVFGKREIIKLVKKAGFSIIKTGVCKGNIYLVARKPVSDQS